MVTHRWWWRQMLHLPTPDTPTMKCVKKKRKKDPSFFVVISRTTCLYLYVRIFSSSTSLLQLCLNSMSLLFSLSPHFSPCCVVSASFLPSLPFLLLHFCCCLWLLRFRPFFLPPSCGDDERGGGGEARLVRCAHAPREEGLIFLRLSYLLVLYVLLLVRKEEEKNPFCVCWQWH